MHRSTATRGVALLVALVLAACGTAPAGTPDATASPSMDHSAMEDHTASPTATATAGATESPSPEPTEAGSEGAEVQLGMSSFSPGTLTVAAGTQVRFVNNSGLPHTVTHGTNGRATDDPAFDRPIGDGATVTITFDEPGTFEVTCKIHPTMNMTITVEG